MPIVTVAIEATKTEASVAMVSDHKPVPTIPSTQNIATSVNFLPPRIAASKTNAIPVINQGLFVKRVCSGLSNPYEMPLVIALVTFTKCAWNQFVALSVYVAMSWPRTPVPGKFPAQR